METRIFRRSIGLAVLLHSAPVLALSGSLAKSYRLDELDQDAPDFAIVDRQGKSFRLNDDRGKGVILHFWASWCDSCRKELPDLRALVSRLDANRWVFLPITVDEEDKRQEA